MNQASGFGRQASALATAAGFASNLNPKT